MSSPSYNSPPGSGLQNGLSLLESWIDARASAQQIFFSEIRSKMTGMPLLDAGIQLAEAVAKQQRDFAHLLLGGIERAVSSRRPGPMEGPDERYRGTGVAPGGADLRADPAPRSPVLRIAVPQGRQAVTAPLQLRNHRATADAVSLSAVAPLGPDVAAIPVELIRFDPQRLIIEPQSERVVHLTLRLPAMVSPGEYWSEIVIEGTETKRIPLSVQILPADSRPAGEP